MGINLLFHPLPSFFDPERRKGLFYPIVITKRARQDAGGLLLFEGGTVLEPALEFMAFRAEKIKGNHFSPHSNKNLTSWDSFGKPFLRLKADQNTVLTQKKYRDGLIYFLRFLG
jgi:hypothetical protein